MLNELDILRDVSQRLDAAGLAYMLTGSMAMNYYAQPRMTRDIDLVVALVATDVDRVVTSFGPDYYVSREAVQRGISNESMFNVIHQESIIKVDLIVRKASAFRLMEFERRRQIIIEDFTTWIVSKEDLILAKLDWGRDSHSELQLRDVRNLASTGYDPAYLEHWTQVLGLTTLWDECRP